MDFCWGGDQFVIQHLGEVVVNYACIGWSETLQSQYLILLLYDKEVGW